MREIVGGKNTIGRTAAVLKSPIKLPLPLTHFITEFGTADLQLQSRPYNFQKYISTCNKTHLGILTIYLTEVAL